MPLLKAVRSTLTNSARHVEIRLAFLVAPPPLGALAALRSVGETRRGGKRARLAIGAGRLR